MKKFILAILFTLVLSGSAYANEDICLKVEDVINNNYPCHTGPRLQELLDSPFFDLMPKPNNMTYDQYRALIKSKIKKWYDGAEQRNKEAEKRRKENEVQSKIQRKNEVDLRCEVLAGQANNSSSARKIYKKCMKAEGY